MATEKRFDVFLSHNSMDKPWVIGLKNLLESHAIKVWLDKDEIRPGDLFAKALERGIRESRSVALIISPESMESGWVENEYYRALSLATHGELQLIPVLYKRAEIPGFLSDRSWVDLSGAKDYEEQLRSLIWGITGIKPEKSPAETLTEPAALLSKELRMYLNSASQIVNQQISMFSAGRSFYEDQCDRAAQQIERLAALIENIRPLLSSNYRTFSLITSLGHHVRTQRELLALFRSTCPPGDSRQRESLVGQLNSLSSLLNSLDDLAGHS